MGLSVRLLSLGCAAALAAPLAAAALDTQLDGQFRVRSILADLSLQKGDRPDRVVDQRLRARWTLGLNEYVHLVYHAELDFFYGDSSYGLGPTQENEGGGLGGDTANLETKGAYLDLRAPDAPLTLRLGLQPMTDRWDQVLVAGDMAGLNGALQGESWKLALGWYKWQEGHPVYEDDVDFWLAQLDVTLSSRASLTLDGYYVNANGPPDGTNRLFPFAPLADDVSGADLYYLGIGSQYRAGDFIAEGWAAFNEGSYDSVKLGDTVSVSAWAASVRGEYAPFGHGGRYAARLIYIPGDDDLADDRGDFFVSPAQDSDQFPFAGDGFLLMLADARGDTYAQPGFALRDGAFAGNGLWAGTLTATYRPPTFRDVFLGSSLGYFSSLTAKDNGHRGNALGTEFALHLGYRMADVVNLSLHSAYAWLGSFYDGTAAGGVDPDTPYQLYFMVDVPY